MGIPNYRERSRLNKSFYCFIQSIILDDLPNDVLEKAAVRTDADGNNISYRIDVLWYYLSKDNIPGTNKSKFDKLFKLAKVILCIIHSNAEEESVLSRIRKNLTPQRASLEFNSTTC